MASNIQEWIKQQRNAGLSEEQIKQLLADHGWTSEQILSLFLPHDHDKKINKRIVGIVAFGTIVLCSGLVMAYFTFISKAGEQLNETKTGSIQDSSITEKKVAIVPGYHPPSNWKKYELPRQGFSFYYPGSFFSYPGSSGLGSDAITFTSVSPDLDINDSDYLEKTLDVLKRKVMKVSTETSTETVTSQEFLEQARVNGIATEEYVDKRNRKWILYRTTFPDLGGKSVIGFIFQDNISQVFLVTTYPDELEKFLMSNSIYLEDTENIDDSLVKEVFSSFDLFEPPSEFSLATSGKPGFITLTDVQNIVSIDIPADYSELGVMSPDLRNGAQIQVLYEIWKDIGSWGVSLDVYTDKEIQTFEDLVKHINDYAEKYPDQYQSLQTLEVNGLSMLSYTTISSNKLKSKTYTFIDKGKIASLRFSYGDPTMAANQELKEVLDFIVHSVKVL